MKGELSLSIFVVEVDLRPVIAFAAKKQATAQAFIQDDDLRQVLRSMMSGGRPLCDDFGMKLRLARPHERAIYHDMRFGSVPFEDFLIALLVEVDDPGSRDATPVVASEHSRLNSRRDTPNELAIEHVLDALRQTAKS